MMTFTSPGSGSMRRTGFSLLTYITSTRLKGPGSSSTIAPKQPLNSSLEQSGGSSAAAASSVIVESGPPFTKSKTWAVRASQLTGDSSLFCDHSLDNLRIPCECIGLEATAGETFFCFFVGGCFEDFLSLFCRSWQL